MATLTTHKARPAFTLARPQRIDSFVFGEQVKEALTARPRETVASSVHICRKLLRWCSGGRRRTARGVEIVHRVQCTVGEGNRDDWDVDARQCAVIAPCVHKCHVFENAAFCDGHCSAHLPRFANPQNMQRVWVRLNDFPRLSLTVPVPPIRAATIDCLYHDDVQLLSRHKASDRSNDDRARRTELSIRRFEEMQ